MLVFLTYQYVWPGVITALLGMKIFAGIAFWGLWGGQTSTKKVGLD